MFHNTLYPWLLTTGRRAWSWNAAQYWAESTQSPMCGLVPHDAPLLHSGSPCAPSGIPIGVTYWRCSPAIPTLQTSALHNRWQPPPSRPQLATPVQLLRQRTRSNRTSTAAPAQMHAALPAEPRDV